MQLLIVRAVIDGVMGIPLTQRPSLATQREHVLYSHECLNAHEDELTTSVEMLLYLGFSAADRVQ